MEDALSGQEWAPAADGERVNENPASAPSGLHRPQQQDPATGEPIVELQPTAPQGLRVSGPGRKERDYQSRIEDLEQAALRSARLIATRKRELQMAALIERGSSRLVTRVEGELGQVRHERDELRQQGQRLVLTLGALQREAELLRKDLAQAKVRLATLSAPRMQRGLWQRLTGGGTHAKRR